MVLERRARDPSQGPQRRYKDWTVADACSNLNYILVVAQVGGQRMPGKGDRRSESVEAAHDGLAGIPASLPVDRKLVRP